MLRPIPIPELFKIDKLYTLYYFQYDKNYKFVGESHDFWEIIYTDQGCITGLNGAEPYTLSKGQLMFHKPNVFHSLGGNGKEDFNVVVISFVGEMSLLENFTECIFSLSLNEKKIITEILDEGNLVYNKPLGKNLVYPVEECDDLSGERTYGSKQMIKINLEKLLIMLYRKQQNCPVDITRLAIQSLTPEHKIVKEIVLFLVENIYNNISFHDISERFNISDTQMKKMFKEVTGYGVIQFYRAIVIEEIKYQIRQFDLNFTEISDLFHLSSVHYFSKFFKRETNLTPSEYLKQSRSL
ncbi:MAG: AraC family transcriptional regulator [Oscillospiraceae bacterium]